MLVEVRGVGWGVLKRVPSTSVLGFQPKLEVFHSSGFYKNCVTAQTERHKSNSLTKKKFQLSALLPSVSQMAGSKARPSLPALDSMRHH